MKRIGNEELFNFILNIFAILLYGLVVFLTIKWEEYRLITIVSLFITANNISLVTKK